MAGFIAFCITLAALAVLAIASGADDAETKRRAAEQRPGDVEQLAGNLSRTVARAGCFVLLFLIVGVVGCYASA
jgi:hypothetical protein